jgi:hypothetical protein
MAPLGFTTTLAESIYAFPLTMTYAVIVLGGWYFLFCYWGEDR